MSRCCCFCAPPRAGCTTTRAADAASAKSLNESCSLLLWLIPKGWPRRCRKASSRAARLRDGRGCFGCCCGNSRRCWLPAAPPAKQWSCGGCWSCRASHASTAPAQACSWSKHTPGQLRDACLSPKLAGAAAMLWLGAERATVIHGASSCCDAAPRSRYVAGLAWGVALDEVALEAGQVLG